MQAAGSSTELSPHACQIPLPEPKRKCRSRAQESYVAERVPAPCLLLISPLVPGRVRVLVGGGGPGLTGGLLTLGSGKVSSPFPTCLHLSARPLARAPCILTHVHVDLSSLPSSPCGPTRPRGLSSHRPRRQAHAQSQESLPGLISQTRRPKARAARPNSGVPLLCSP